MGLVGDCTNMTQTRDVLGFCKRTNFWEWTKCFMDNGVVKKVLTIYELNKQIFKKIWKNDRFVKTEHFFKQTFENTIVF